LPLIKNCSFQYIADESASADQETDSTILAASVALTKSVISRGWGLVFDQWKTFHFCNWIDRKKNRRERNLSLWPAAYPTEQFSAAGYIQSAPGEFNDPTDPESTGTGSTVSCGQVALDCFSRLISGHPIPLMLSG
jgi:hypothetical protein